MKRIANLLGGIICPLLVNTWDNFCGREIPEGDKLTNGMHYINSPYRSLR